MIDYHTALIDAMRRNIALCLNVDAMRVRACQCQPATLPTRVHRKYTVDGEGIVVKCLEYRGTFIYINASVDGDEPVWFQVMSADWRAS